MAAAHKIRLHRQRRLTILTACAAVGLLLQIDTEAAAQIPAKNRAAIDRAVDFLRTQLPENGINGGDGASVLAAYAVIKGKASLDAPYDVSKDAVVMGVVQAVLKKVNAKGQYKGSGIYSAGVDMMLLEAAAKPKGKYNAQLQAMTDYVVKNQDKEGFWNYLGGDKHGDTSVTQYGALGLWAAARAGIRVPPLTWDRMAGWLINTQFAHGGWTYRPTSPTGDSGTQSMTVAGSASLYVAVRHLYPKELSTLR